MNQPGDDIAIIHQGRLIHTAKYIDLIALIEAGLLRVTRLENGCIKAVTPTEAGRKAVDSDFETTVETPR